MQVIPGNTNTYLEAKRELEPAILASRLRILPYSYHRRTVCMRVEIYGCYWRGKCYKPHLLSLLLTYLEAKRALQPAILASRLSKVDDINLFTDNGKLFVCCWERVYVTSILIKRRFRFHFSLRFPTTKSQPSSLTGKTTHTILKWRLFFYIQSTICVERLIFFITKYKINKNKKLCQFVC